MFLVERCCFLFHQQQFRVFVFRICRKPHAYRYCFANYLSTNPAEKHFDINENKTITGKILSKDYLRYFSIKFYKTIKRLEKLYNTTEHDKSAGTAFIYSNLVKAGGIEIFAETLIQNGYLEYQDETSNYDIKDETVDYKTALTYLEFKKQKRHLLPVFNPRSLL